MAKKKSSKKRARKRYPIASEEERTRRGRPPLPIEKLKHGSGYAYRTRGCRCDRCLEWRSEENERQAETRQRRSVEARKLKRGGGNARSIRGRTR